MTRLNHRLADVPFSVFEELNGRLAEQPPDRVFALHQGKTWFEPLAGSPLWPSGAFDLEAHQHAPPAGLRSLREEIATHLSRRHHLHVQADQVVVTAGATHGVSLVLGAVLDPGDEVLVASPQWLFTNGLVEAAGGVPVEVPVFSLLAEDPNADIVTALDEAWSERCRALYFNTPNNPSGVSLTPAQFDALAAWAERRDVWLISDNAYENFDFTAHGFRDMAHDAPERTFSVYSFSKTFAMPGYRVGYVVCPRAAAARMRKWALYSVYSVPTVSQHAAACALATPDDELARRHDLARQARDLTAQRLVVPHYRVEGGLYAFVNLSGWGYGEPAAFLKACVDAGIGLAPGRAFGDHCPDRARLCFTATPPDRLARALDVINQLYVGGPG